MPPMLRPTSPAALPQGLHKRMKAMARQRCHSIEFKRQVAQEFIAGESLYALSKRHDISRQSDSRLGSEV